MACIFERDEMGVFGVVLAACTSCSDDPRIVSGMQKAASPAGSSVWCSETMEDCVRRSCSGNGGLEETTRKMIVVVQQGILPYGFWVWVLGGERE